MLALFWKSIYSYGLWLGKVQIDWNQDGSSHIKPILSDSSISLSPGFQLASTIKKKKKVIIMKQILYISNTIVSKK